MKITKKKLADLALLIFLSAVWFAIGWTLRGWRLGPEIGLIEQVRKGLQENYPFELPTDRQLTYAAIHGMLIRTGDAHAALLEPVVSQRFQDDFSGEAGVIGIVAESRQGEIVVTDVFPGEPADLAGLHPGDVLLSVDGVFFSRLSTDTEAALLIRGRVGTPAHVLARRGAQELQFDPIRSPRPIASGEMLESGIGYLAHYRFSTNSPEKVKAILEELLAQHPKGLVWDLRSNGGGSMDAAQLVLSYFIKDGLLFRAELKGGQLREFVATGQPVAPDLPLVVLVGPNTYSSAETAAAAVRERNRGILVGSTTHGKGTIQNTIPLQDGSMLQFTLAKWLSPSGEWFEGQGVDPDVKIVDDPNTPEDEVLQAALAALLEK